MQTQRVKCPRCSRWWVAYAGEGEMACNCHTYCEDGDKPSDCSVTPILPPLVQDVRVSQATDDARVHEVGVAHPPWDNIDTTPAHIFIGKSGAVYYGGGLRFTNVNITQGATILNASIDFISSSTRVGAGTNTLIDGEDADNAVTFSTVADYNARTRTTASQPWIIVTTWTNGVTQPSPSLKTIVQEIVDRVGWRSGNSLVFFWEDDGTSTDYRLAYSYERDATKTPILHLEWTIQGITAVKDYRLAWPTGLHGGERLGPPPADNPMRRYSYCSVHNKFIVAPPIVFPVEWKTFYAKRAKKESRFNRGV